MENPKKKVLVMPNEVAEEDIENVNFSFIVRRENLDFCGFSLLKILV